MSFIKFLFCEFEITQDSLTYWNCLADVGLQFYFEVEGFIDDDLHYSTLLA